MNKKRKTTSGENLSQFTNIGTVANIKGKSFKEALLIPCCHCHGNATSYKEDISMVFNNCQGKS